VLTYDHPLDEHYRSYYLRARDETMATVEIGVKVNPVDPKPKTQNPEPRNRNPKP